MTSHCYVACNDCCFGILRRILGYYFLEYNFDIRHIPRPIRKKIENITELMGHGWFYGMELKR